MFRIGQRIQFLPSQSEKTCLKNGLYVGSPSLSSGLEITLSKIRIGPILGYDLRSIFLENLPIHLERTTTSIRFWKKHWSEKVILKVQTLFKKMILFCAVNEICNGCYIFVTIHLDQSWSILTGCFLNFCGFSGNKFSFFIIFKSFHVYPYILSLLKICWNQC